MLDVGELGTLLSHETDDGDACWWTGELSAFCPDFRVTRNGLVGSGEPSEILGVGVTQLFSAVSKLTLSESSSEGGGCCFNLSLDLKILVDVLLDCVST